MYSNENIDNVSVNEEIKENETVSTEASSENVEKPKSKNKPDTSSAISEEFLPENFDPFARVVNPKFAKVKKETDFEDRVINIKRVIKVTKGGRRFKFSALVVSGNKKGKVGFAIGKNIEVPEAIKKATRQSKKNMIDVKIVGSQDTIPHEIIGKNGSARVMLKPAAEGKGIIASDVVRSVVELAGIRNIYSKNLGTNNPQNVILATIDGLSRMKTAEEFAALKKKEERKSFDKKDKRNSEGNK